jgi:Uncharacterised nucleotidyltransferase
MPSPLFAAVRSLSFGQNRQNHLEGLSDHAWRDLLRLTDRSQLTLPLAGRCSGSLPNWVRERVQRDLLNNAIRHERTMRVYESVNHALTSRGIRFAVLKGFTQWPFYCDDLKQRPQYDLDLYCRESDIGAAYQAITALGYEPFRQKPGTPLDHLSPLIRKTGWRPKDDYYDPDMPLTIELHFRFWDSETERFQVRGADTFWDRRCIREIAGLRVSTLHPGDALSYTCWHLMRHLLRGDLRAYHVYELAHFLQRTAGHDNFWRDWHNTRESPFLETIAFRLAMEWFQCQGNPTVEELMQSLPPEVERWFTIFGFSPLAGLEWPNKDELFLHFALVNSVRERLHIAKRRLLPFRFNPVVVDAHVPSAGAGLRWKRRVLGAWFMGKRMVHHARAILPLIRSGLRWRLALTSGHTSGAETDPR